MSWTIQEIVKANKKAGYFFFAEATMKAFFTRLLKNSVFEGREGIYFIVENRKEEEFAPHYAIRLFDPQTGSVNYPRHADQDSIKHPRDGYGVIKTGFSDFVSAKAARRYARRLSYGGLLDAQTLYTQPGVVLDGAGGDAYNNKRLVEIAIEQGYTGDVKLGVEDGEFDHELAQEIVDWLSENCCAPELYLQFENGGDLLCMHEGVDYDDPSRTVEEQLEELRSGFDLGDIDFADEIREEAQANCYYATSTCDGRLWECATCGEKFCSETHNHYTSKGTNIECVGCERVRLGNEEAAEQKTLLQGKDTDGDTESQDDGRAFIDRWNQEGYGVAHVRYDASDDPTEPANTVVLMPYADADEFDSQKLTISGADAQLPDGTWLVLHSGGLEELYHKQRPDGDR